MVFFYRSETQNLLFCVDKVPPLPDFSRKKVNQAFWLRVMALSRAIGSGTAKTTDFLPNPAIALERRVTPRRSARGGADLRSRGNSNSFRSAQGTVGDRRGIDSSS
jgi:hypothetical protein